MNSHELPIEEMNDFQLLEKAKEMSLYKEDSEFYIVSIFIVLRKKLKLNLNRSTKIALREGKNVDKKITFELLVKMINDMGDTQFKAHEINNEKVPVCTLGHIIYIDATLNAGENKTNFMTELSISRNKLIDITKH